MRRLLATTAVGNLLFAATLSLGACTAQSVAAGTSSLTVVAAGPEQVSVQAERAPLDTVIAELARQTGLGVDWLGPRGSEPITARFDRVRLEVALERILLDRNHGIFLSNGRPARVVIGSTTSTARRRTAPSLAAASDRGSTASDDPSADELPVDELPAVAMDDELALPLDDAL